MAKNINITELLSNDQPTIQIGDKQYAVDNSVQAVMKIEELAGDGGTKSVLSAIEAALGEIAYKEIGVAKLPVPNIKVLMIAIMAATQNLTYEEASARFQRAEQQI